MRGGECAGRDTKHEIWMKRNERKRKTVKGRYLILTWATIDAVIQLDVRAIWLGVEPPARGSNSAAPSESLSFWLKLVLLTPFGSPLMLLRLSLSLYTLLSSISIWLFLSIHPPHHLSPRSSYLASLGTSKAFLFI